MLTIKTNPLRLIHLSKALGTKKDILMTLWGDLPSKTVALPGQLASLQMTGLPELPEKAMGRRE